MQFVKSLIILIFLIACVFSPHKSILSACEYSIGHRIGGHIPGQIDNTLKAFKAALPLQSHKCFGVWEFDVNQTKDGHLVLWHNIKNNGKHIKDIYLNQLPSYVPTIWEFLSEIKKSKIIKPMAIDLKYINSSYWGEIVDFADKLTGLKIGVTFYTSMKRKKHYLKLCNLIRNKYKLIFYQGPEMKCSK